MKYTITATLLAILISQPAAAEGIYLKGFGGAVFGGDHDVERDGPDEVQHQIETKTGFAAGGALGLDFNSWLSAEAEVAYRRQEVDLVTVAIDPPVPQTHLSSVSLMANAVASLRDRAGFTPYFGAGVGSALIGREDHRDWRFAYQGFAGVERPIAAGFTAGVEYRYFTAVDAPYPRLEHLDAHYAVHSVNLTLKRGL